MLRYVKVISFKNIVSFVFLFIIVMPLVALERRPVRQTTKESTFHPTSLLVFTTEKKQLAVKTNALYLAGGVTNLGIEYPISHKFSIDLPFYYSPYKIANNYRISVLAIQPELRYWFAKPLSGSFVGLHAHGGYFNVSLNKKNRYQDLDGDTPLWGFGLSYGYVFALSGNWFMELTLGAGYANIKYDAFRNYHNGPKYDSGRTNYWGLTRAGVSVVYKINLNK